MSTNLQAVTGHEVFWGSVTPTRRQLELVNRSPTFVAQIHEADEQVKTGRNKPMQVRDIQGPYYFDREGVIAFPRDYRLGLDEDFLGKLAHELGHQIYAPADEAFRKRYRLNPRDPDAHNAATLWPLRAQSEGELNHWKIGNEILRNTAGPGQPGVDIKQNLDDGIGRLFDDESAKHAKAGLTQQQSESRLVAAGMQHLAPGPSSEGPGSEYTGFGFLLSAAAPIEGGDPTSVSYRQADNGGITSSAQTWQSGDISTQTYKDGKLQTAQTVDPSGKPLRTASYRHRPDGGYSVNVSDGAGRTIQWSDFNANGSGG
jgi:hypothetical protein